MDKKDYDKLSWEEKRILDGSINQQVNVRDFSDLGYFPTLTISGFFYKFITHTNNDSLTSNVDLPFETFCKNYNIPFIRGLAYNGNVHVKGKARLHFVPSKIVDSYGGFDWKYLSSVKGLDEEGFDLFLHPIIDKEIELLKKYDEDFSNAHVFVEFISHPYSYPATYTEYMVPVDAINISKLFREVGIKIQFHYDSVDRKILQRARFPATSEERKSRSHNGVNLLFDEDYGDIEENKVEIKKDDHSYEFYKAHGFDYEDYDFID